VNRIHIITLGVQDINLSLRFYRDGLGFSTTAADDNSPIAFFQSLGVTLALYPKEGLAQDIIPESPPQGSGFGGVTLGVVVNEKSEVARILTLAEKTGGRIVKPAQQTFWGGWHGYFSDPDGYFWEVMYWDDWKFKADGSLDIE
jgi:catechol 2,3-dioxygenase-like lactoylglutathione lyase family enzyme